MIKSIMRHLNKGLFKTLVLHKICRYLENVQISEVKIIKFWRAKNSRSDSNFHSDLLF